MSKHIAVGNTLAKNLRVAMEDNRISDTELTALLRTAIKDGVSSRDMRTASRFWDEQMLASWNASNSVAEEEAIGNEEKAWKLYNGLVAEWTKMTSSQHAVADWVKAPASAVFNSIFRPEDKSSGQK